MKKDIWIIVIILCVLGILAVIYKVWQDGKNGLIEKFNPEIQVGATKYSHLNNNLVSNGYFLEGQPPLEFAGSIGDAEIIVFQNSGQSSYVLKQSSSKSLDSNNPIFYKLQLKLKPQTIYYLGCLYLSTKNYPLNHMVIFNNTEKIFLKTIVEPDYSYSKKSVNKFEYKYTLFQTPVSNDLVNTSIYLSYNKNNIEGFNYITDIGVYELLNINTFIPINENLRSYFNPFNPQSVATNSIDLRDVSNQGFDFRASVAKQIEVGKITLLNNILTGPSAFKLQNSGALKLTNNFTFFIFVRANRDNKLIENFENETNGAVVSTKNTNTSQMNYDSFQELWKSIGCSGIINKNDPIIAWWKTQPIDIVIEDMKQRCDKTNNLTQFKDSDLIKPGKIITTTDKSSLDKELAKYNTVNIINFPGNQNIAVSLHIPKVYGSVLLVVGGTIYQTFIKITPFMLQLFAVAYDGTNIRLYINEELTMETICPRIYFDNQNVVINPDGNFNGQLYAFAYFNRYLKEYKIIKINRYFFKLVSTGTETSLLTPEMEKIVASFQISDVLTSEEEEPSYDKAISNDNKKTSELSKIIPSSTQIPYSSDSDQFTDQEPGQSPIIYEEQDSPLIYEVCPNVIYEDGHYYVVIKKGSDLEKKLGYSGVRDYGTNIDTAKFIYETNFPKCKVPDILDRRKYKGNFKDCPFIIMNQENPCNKYECRDVDWKTGIPKDGNCKRAVDIYCSKYSDADPACFCWKPENKNNAKCLKWRGNFDSPEKCDFRKYPIQNHPDADKYIRKDKIPCWGCNLDAPESTGNYTCFDES